MPFAGPLLSFLEESIQKEDIQADSVVDLTI